MLINLGSIVQSVNGPNLIIAEMANNINLLQESTAQLENMKFNESLRLFIDRLFSSKRQALPKHSSEKVSSYVRLGLKFQLPDNHTVMAHLKTINSLSFTLHGISWKKRYVFQFMIQTPQLKLVIPACYLRMRIILLVVVSLQQLSVIKYKNIVW